VKSTEEAAAAAAGVGREKGVDVVGTIGKAARPREGRFSWEGVHAVKDGTGVASSGGGGASHTPSSVRKKPEMGHGGSDRQETVEGTRAGIGGGEARAGSRVENGRKGEGDEEGARREDGEGVADSSAVFFMDTSPGVLGGGGGTEGEAAAATPELWGGGDGLCDGEKSKRRASRVFSSSSALEFDGFEFFSDEDIHGGHGKGHFMTPIKK